jgi:transcriptional regulator with XRE-family HTH domain
MKEWTNIMELDYIALGKNIKRHRLLAEMTQGQLAEIVECCDRHIGQIESGKNIPSLAVTVKVANALGVGIDQLLYGDLKNRGDYFIQELVALTEEFESKDKLMSMELVKALIGVLKDFK